MSDDNTTDTLTLTAEIVASYLSANAPREGRLNPRHHPLRSGRARRD